MRSVKINKAELLDIVRKNQQSHIAAHLEAVEDYKVVALQIAKKNLRLAKTGDPNAISESQALPRAPESYEDHYRRAIRMLELSVEDVIELEEDIFNQLVLNEWSWKHHFSATASTYKTFISGAMR